MIEASCHCGAVRLELPRRPRRVTSCNCSICRRYGTLWAYYRSDEVQVTGRTKLVAYAWGERRIRHLRCGTCGCVTHWLPTKAPGSARMGVNARNLDPKELKRVRIRHLDGAATWKYLD